MDNNDLIRRSDAIETIRNQCVIGKMWGGEEAESTLIDAYDTIDEVSDIPAVDAVEIDTLGNALRKAIIAERDSRTKEQAYGWEWEYNGFNYAIQAVTSTCIELKRQMDGRREDGIRATGSDIGDAAQDVLLPAT